MDDRVILAYDVADDRRRYRVCKTVERYGERIQYSVFELALPSKDLHKLVDDLQSIMDTQDDRLLVIRLCGGCQEVIGRYGKTTMYNPAVTLII